MKIVHYNKEEPASFETARTKEGDATDDAIRMYKRLITARPHDERIYHRLMILFRKEKNYRKELAVIRKGIKNIRTLYQPRKSRNDKVNAISKSLIRALSRSEGVSAGSFEKEPIATWKKREMTVLRLIERSKNKK